MKFLFLLSFVCTLGMGSWARGDTKEKERVLHLSVIEAHFDRETQRLELNVRLFPNDLEAALSHFANKTITIKKSDELAATAISYLRQKLIIKSPSGEQKTLEWGGLDITSSHIWLFLEVASGPVLNGMRISDRLLQEEFPDQINSVEITGNGPKQVLVFSRETDELEVGNTKATP